MHSSCLFKHSFSKLIHPEIHKLLVKYNAWAVGGSLASIIMHAGDRDSDLRKHVNDIDIYFETAVNETAINDATESLTGASPEDIIEQCYRTQCATTLYSRDSRYPPLQILHLRSIYGIDRTHWDVTNALNKFDFTAIQLGYLLDSNQLCSPSWEKALMDIAARRLILSDDVDYPISTLVRVHKYLKKGFSIAPSQLVKLAIKINQCDISTIHKLKSQLYGIDMALLEPVIRAMEVGMLKSDVKLPEDARVHFLAELDAYLSARV